ncbi:guanylate kinase [Atractiella rhizophila]|nr:guanylate kinase [Atractiella rhizophila]
MAQSFTVPPAKARGPIVVCGPSGCGKSTLLKRLFEEFPDTFAFSVSHTTRVPRQGEEDGKHYHFVTVQEFEDLIADNAFIEHANFSGNRYGTTVKAVEAVELQGKRCVLDIDTQGVRTIHAIHPPLSARTLFTFLSPPSPALKSLHSRLSGRGTESSSSLRSRLLAAQGELEYAAQEGSFDVVVVNDNVDVAYQKLRALAVEGVVTGAEGGDPLPDISKEEDISALLD